MCIVPVFRCGGGKIYSRWEPGAQDGPYGVYRWEIVKAIGINMHY